MQGNRSGRRYHQQQFSQNFQVERGRGSSAGLLAVLSGASLSNWRKTGKFLFTVAFLSIASAAATWLLTRESIADKAEASPPEVTVDCSSLRELLEELTRRFFRVAREVSVVARDIREKLKARDAEVPNDRALRSEMARQCQIAERFGSIREELLAERGVTEEAVARLSEDDAEAVRQHREGVEKMLEEALGGILPSMLGVVVPADITVEKLLGYHMEMLQLKLEKIKQLASVTKGKTFAPEELGRAAALISQAAETEVLEKHQKVLGKGGEVFHTAMAQHCREEAFRLRLNALDAEHRKLLIAAFRANA